MDIGVMSKRSLKEFIEEGFYDKLAVISFYSENEYPITLPDDVKSFIVKADDHDLEALKEENISYGQYLPEADRLAEFVFEAYRENYQIICQCRYGESISAGCAAAIAEYFDGNGIEFFSDYRFCPNQLVYSKIYNALDRYGGRIENDERRAYFFSRKYGRVFREKLDSADENYDNVLDFLNDAKEIIADRYGNDSGFIADILADRGLILCRRGQYAQAARQYETAAEMYTKNDKTIEKNYAKEQLAKALVRSEETDAALKLAKEIAEYNKVNSGYLLAYIYGYINDYPNALTELQAIIDNAETPNKKIRAVCEMGRFYYRIGEKKTAVKYLSEACRLLSEREEPEYEGFYMFG
ncbi:MAG: hypothetical protein ACI4SF_12155 [Oscillospiraceae bacterium]